MGADGTIKMPLPRTGVPLGIRPDTTYTAASEITLASGDLVLLTTDGIEETMLPDNTIFGIERLLEVVRANRHRPAAEIVQTLYESVRAFCRNAPQADDVTTIVLKVR